MANLIKISSARWAFNCRNWNPSESDWLLLSSGIQCEEKERIGKFVFRRDGKSAMAGRLLIRKFLTNVTGLSWREIIILRDLKTNKPYFLSDQFKNIHFNISHSGDFVILAGHTGNIKLGIDIMKIDKKRSSEVPEFFRLMSRHFSEEEMKNINLPSGDSDKMKMFYRYWCLKESYSKAIGIGINGIDLKTLNFRINTFDLSKEKYVDDTELYMHGVKQNDWLFQEILIDDLHSAAVALYNYKDVTGINRQFSVIKYNDLISEIQPILPLDPEYSAQFIAKPDVP